VAGCYAAPMAQVLVNTDDLLRLVQKCKEFNLQSRAYRALAGSEAEMRIEYATKPDDIELLHRYGEQYKEVKRRADSFVSLRYTPLEKAIADGIDVAHALKTLVDSL
jgi:hypothetical protein